MSNNSGQKSYLITGASRGVGREIREVLTGQGAQVYSLCRTTPGNGTCSWTECDLADKACVERVVGELNESGPAAFDGVFLNAARAAFGNMADMPAREMEAIFRVNMFSHMELLSGLRSKLPGGTPVIYISTSASRIPAPQMGVYAASKLAMEGAMQSMCMEEGWKLSILRPAEIDTEFATQSGVPGEFDAGVRKLAPQEVAQEAVDCLKSGKLFANIGLRAKIIDAVVRICPQFLMKRRQKTDETR